MRFLGKHWDRSAGSFVEPQTDAPEDPEKMGKEATCSCGLGIPVQKVQIGGQEVTLIALPLIFEQFRQAGKHTSETSARELLDTVKIYNPVPEGADEQYLAVLLQEYTAFCEKEIAR